MIHQPTAVSSSAAASSSSAAAAVSPSVSPDAQPMSYRRLLRQDVHEILLRDFIEGVYTPGERIHDDTIARRLGVSRTPIREALSRLALSGLVDTAPNRYTRVTDLVTEDGIASLEVIEALLQLALSGIVPRLDEEDVIEIEFLLRRFDARREPDAFAMYEALRGFCSDRLHAPMLEELLGIAQPRLLRVLRLLPEVLESAGGEPELRAFAEDLLRRDAPAAARRLHRIFEGLAAAMTCVLERTEAAAAAEALGMEA